MNQFSSIWFRQSQSSSATGDDISEVHFVAKFGQFFFFLSSLVRCFIRGKSQCLEMNNKMINDNDNLFALLEIFSW